MANPQMFQQNKGTLMPGQSITVNKFSVQVERYLSQGGFAHVYLVRTATPVYNTTHHVLKRIAVANEAMLSEVKKEVDIMRLLKGHPNIVHLIDAAWHKMANGMYEVFILMEFCPGGGIIDMMNRRLRERLTEAEILQIFVDVCEGVACMHNLRPPLLHRDLKVENILQSSPTSFKLCDFGSATTVASRPPATTQEIRALEADLNRHTTLQYRAPEMVDPFLRRPVDEKSDVWALGVLLYKLCYYTTPFEEHGPLAILNVQYKTPPYPVYSPQMNALIGSMLREHGLQRPSVFELLSQVHRLRGTKSPYQYSIPVAQPLSPRHQSHYSPPATNPLDNTISYRAAHQHAQQHSPSTRVPNTSALSVSPSKNAGIQARDKVLDAIEPMRRGRPGHSKDESISRPSSSQGGPQKESEKRKDWLDGGFDAEEERAWKSVAAKAPTSGKVASEDAWAVGARGRSTPGEINGKRAGFGDDFGEKLWDSFDPSNKAHPPALPNRGIVSPPSDAAKEPKFSATSTFIGSDAFSAKRPSALRGKEQDAFEGLGLMTSSNSKPPPTLAEARKLRTGLAVMSTNSSNGYATYDSNKSTITRPTPSPRPTHLAQPQSSLSPTPLNPANSGSSWSSQPPSSRPSSSNPADGVPPESRYPTLEELDATFSGPSPNTRGPSTGAMPGAHASSQPQLASSRSLQKPTAGDSTGLRRPTLQPPVGSYGMDGVRSQQVTGVAMRESRGDTSSSNRPGKYAVGAGAADGASASSPKDGSADRPSLTRRHRSSMSIKPKPGYGADASTSSNFFSSSSPREPATPSSSGTPRQPPRPSKDWLTGDDDSSTSSHIASTSGATPRSSAAEVPVLRDSPSKRASFIEKSSAPIQEAHAALHDHIGPPASPHPSLLDSPVSSSSPTVSRFVRKFPALDTATKDQEPAQSPVDDWTPLKTTAKRPAKQKEVESSSSADEGPEDVVGYVPSPVKSADNTRMKRKGRQSSVHDLVDLWGGGPKEKEEDLTRSTITSASYNKPTETNIKRRSTALPSLAKPIPRSKSPQPMLSPPGFGRASSSHSTKFDSTQQEQADVPELTPSPVSSRSRPQSMFLFPSKTPDSSVPLSGGGGLVPPEEPKPRNTRRTSISDMVHRYEAIGAVTKTTGAGAGAGAVPPVATKPPALAVASRPLENGRTARPSISSSTVTKGSQSNGRSGLSVPIRDEPTGGFRDNTKSRVSPTGLPRASPISPLPSSKDEIQQTREPETRAPRPRRISMKPESSNSIFPSQKLPASTEDASGRSASPERPYQGVGKLIDQWQRKTVDRETERGPVVQKRGGFAAKRAGLVSGGTGRGQ